MEEKITEIDISEIKISDRYRKEMGDIESLAESIDRIGLIQPIILDRELNLIAGERRIRAHKHLGRTKIKAIVKSYVSNEAVKRKIAEIVENIERKNFEWQEEVLAKKDLHDLYTSINEKWSLRKTSEETGISLGGLSTDINLAKAIEEDPEMFKGCRTKDAAIKVLKKYELDEAMAELALRQTKTDYGKKASTIVKRGDCIKLMRSLPDHSIRAVITDPPYGIDMDKQKKIKDLNEVALYVDDEDHYKTMFSAFAKELQRILSKDACVVIFHSTEHHQFVHDTLTSVGIHCATVPAVWVRNIGQCRNPSTHLASSYEPFSYGFIGGASLVKQGRNNVFQYKGVHESSKVHGVQKPLALMEDIIEHFCLPGDVVLDPFCGSGTTLVAAIKRGCKPIGFELSGNYYQAALLRVENALRAKDAGKLDTITDQAL